MSVRQRSYSKRATRQHRNQAKKILKQPIRSHRNQQAVHIDAGLPFTSSRVNGVGDRLIHIENETETDAATTQDNLFVE